jgi:hypothetical protein
MQFIAVTKCGGFSDSGSKGGCPDLGQVMGAKVRRPVMAVNFTYCVRYCFLLLQLSYGRSQFFQELREFREID